MARKKKMVKAETGSSVIKVNERPPEYEGQPKLFREKRIVKETIFAAMPVKFVEKFCWVDEDFGMQVMFDVYDIATTVPIIDEDDEPYQLSSPLATLEDLAKTQSIENLQ